MMDNRRSPRLRVLKAGKIVFNNACSVIDCVVRNRSESGASLQCEGVLGIPDEFVLVIEAEGARLTCRVVRRQQGRIAVAFVR